MAIKQLKQVTDPRRFFLEPISPRHRMYEALRAFFLGERSAQDVARAFGYAYGALRNLASRFRKDPTPELFFAAPRHGPQAQPKKSAARELIVDLRKKNYSVYDISAVLKERGYHLSPTAVDEVLKAEGFAPLPRRLDEERPARLSVDAEPVADVRSFALTPGKFTTRFGGLFLFVPDLVRLELVQACQDAELPGSSMVPVGHAVRAALALKLWCIARKSHVMSLLADEGLALFCGLNAMPKKSFLSEYSSRIDHAQTTKLLSAWHDHVRGEKLFTGESFNLDFHSVPYFGEHPVVERHYVSGRSRRQASVLVFLAQDADGRAFCYSNADIRKGEEADEILRFISFWKNTHKKLPGELVFDSQLTTQANLVALDDMSIPFITLRRRSPQILADVQSLPASAWRRVELDVPTRKYRHPRIVEQTVKIKGRSFRQLYVLDLGHEEPTVLLTNRRTTTPKELVTRYAQRMIIENVISDAIRFFHMDALSSAVALKADFDMALLAIASGLYRLMAKRMRGYCDAQARTLFRDLIDMPADVTIGEDEVTVRLHRRVHLPIVLASGILDTSVEIPWWSGRRLRITA
jgi:transposase